MLESLSDAVLFSQSAPTNSAFAFQVVLRVLHLFSAIILVGGLFYQRAVLVSSGPDACYANNRGAWAKWVGIATLLLLATGLYDYLTIRNGALAAGISLPRAYHMLFGIKFLLGLWLMFLSAVLAGKSGLAEKFRQKMGMWLNIAWTSSLAILVIAAMMRSMR